MFSPQDQRRIPILMATQHPDNAGVPFWSDSAFVSMAQETDEIYEALFTLDCDEYMWDWEGKFADEAMVERLAAKHLEQLKKTQIGRDKFVTLRIPNIWEEKSFKLARAYMSTLSAAEFMRSLDLHAPPVFEFILPMTRRADQLMHIQETFQKTAKLHQEIFGHSDFGPGYIHIIPLIEQVEDFYRSGELLREFFELHQEHFGFLPPYLRPFIARSDPALNAGYVPAILGCRMILREAARVGKEFGVPIYPMVGTGSLPFRGGINPENIKESLPQYQGAKTISIQSAFRYDYELEEVREALSYIREECQEVKPVEFSDEDLEALYKLCDTFADFYRPTVESFAHRINAMAKHVPSRRERVQHIGMFGYSRGVGEVSLPRAIKFTAACYSMGVPPEFIGTGRGLRATREAGQLDFLLEHFFTLKHELQHAGKFLNMENLREWAEQEEWAREVMEDVQLCQEILGIELGPQKDHHFLHRNLTSNIALKQRMGLDLDEDILEAAVLRKSLG